MATITKTANGKGETRYRVRVVVGYRSDGSAIQQMQSFRTKKDRSLELTSVSRECPPGRRKLAVKVVDIFGNDTMTIVEVSVGGKK